jgi:hypothetical protein
MRPLTRTLLLALAAASAIGASGDPPPQQAPAGPPAVRRSGPADDIEDFVPTQKVRADDAVAFPTDI